MKNRRFRIILLLIISIIAFCQYSCKDDLITNIIDEVVIDKDPCWSHNGLEIIYVSGSEPLGITSINSNGSNKHLVNSNYGRNIDISPDGNWIAYVIGGNIFKERINGKDSIVQLTFEVYNFSPSWSKDGNWIAFSSNNNTSGIMSFIWKMRSDGSEKKRIFYTPTLGEVREPDWFPDGIRLAVSRYVGHGSPEIGIIDTLGNALGELTNDRIDDTVPKVSPDGNYIVFQRLENTNNVMVMKVDGSELKQISQGQFPNWSGDGLRIVFANTTDGRIWTMLSNGTFKTKISY